MTCISLIISAAEQFFMSFVICISFLKNRDKQNIFWLKYNRLSLSGKESICNEEMQEMWVQSLSWEDPLEEGLATHASIIA